jgi:hypothetical protein
MYTCTLDSSTFIEHIFNPVHQQIRIAQRLVSEVRSLEAYALILTEASDQ